MSAFDSSMAGLNSACLSTFGQEVTYTPSGGSATQITGILAEPNRMDGVSPGTFAVLSVRTADAPSAQTGDTVAIVTKTYRVLAVMADLGGMTKLSLGS